MSSNKVDILLVEDNNDEAELTIRALRNNKCNSTILHLKNGEEALNYIFCKGSYELRNISDYPKLILLDLKMPKINGIEVLRRIKSDERTKVIPTVVLTSSREERDIQQSYNLGVNSYCVKPLDFDDYVDAVSNLGLYWIQMNQLPY